MLLPAAHCFCGWCISAHYNMLRAGTITDMKHQYYTVIGTCWWSAKAIHGHAQLFCRAVAHLPLPLLHATAVDDYDCWHQQDIVVKRGNMWTTLASLDLMCT